MYVCQTINFESLHVGSSFLQIWYTSRGYGSSSYININCFSILLDTMYLAVLFFYFVMCPCSSRTKRHDNLFVDDDDDDDKGHQVKVKVTGAKT